MNTTTYPKFRGFKYWFTKYHGLMHAVEEIKIASETEKAYKLIFEIDPKFGRSFIEWAPKSAVITDLNYEEAQREREEKIKKWREANPELAKKQDEAKQLRELIYKWKNKLWRLEKEAKALNVYAEDLKFRLSKINKSKLGWLDEQAKAYKRALLGALSHVLYEKIRAKKLTPQDRIEILKVAEERE